MKTISLTCHHCNAPVKAPAAALGKALACPVCNGLVAVIADPAHKTKGNYNVILFLTVVVPAIIGGLLKGGWGATAGGVFGGVLAVAIISLFDWRTTRKFGKTFWLVLAIAAAIAFAAILINTPSEREEWKALQEKERKANSPWGP